MEYEPLGWLLFSEHLMIHTTPSSTYMDHQLLMGELDTNTTIYRSKLQSILDCATVRNITALKTRHQFTRTLNVA